MKLYKSLPSVVKKSKKRVGRGYGSGVGGHTSTRGAKGQLARNKVPLWFEGGQLPLIKRLPMLRGKGRLVSLKKEQTISLSQLDKLTVSLITIEALKTAKLISRATNSVKVLNGKLSRSIEIQGLKLSASALKTLEKAGGKVL